MAGSSRLHSDPSVLWYHPAFCQMALPVSDTAERSWRRRVDNMMIALEAATDDTPLPSGWCLRRLLMHLCDHAVRTASPLVEMGADAAELAAELGLPAVEPVLREITVQADRLAAKLTLSLDGQTVLSVLDARGQSRRAASAWRPRLRLNARFHASLMEQAVPLDRRIVTALRTEALALDAHGWTRHLLHGQAPDQTTTVTWEDLLRRFGSPGQELAAFQTAFEDALRMVFAADPAIALAADESGVTVGSAAAGNEAAASSTQPAKSEHVSPAAAAEPDRTERRPSDMIGLRPHLTGLPGVVWLRRGHGDEPPVIGVTRGTRWEPERLTMLLLEPLIMQVTGGLPQKEFDMVSAWAMANRDLIDLVWEDKAGPFEQVASRVKKVPALGWRQS